MRPVLIEIFGLPIYGYGFMLFLAFIAVNFLAKRLCQREGIEPKLILDMIVWLFVAGIAGARANFIIQYWNDEPHRNWVGFANRPWLDMVKLWDGGLVFYGSIFGGAIGYFIYWWYFLRPHRVSNWKMLDVVAPCIAVGLALGRIGCLFTGCCYGNAACDTCPAIYFPINAMASNEMMRRGMQTQFGFLLKDDSLEVKAVEPNSAAAKAGLQPGDSIDEANGMRVVQRHQLANALEKALRDPSQEVELKVKRTNDTIAFVPTSIGINPTQIYETISMSLLLFFLLSYYPFKRHNGEIMVFLMFGYGVHRFLNESLRTDTDPVAFGLTYSQNVSLLVLAMGAVLALAVWRRPLIADEPPPAPPPTDTNIMPAPSV